MANAIINNNWYLYQSDVYGVNGLLTFQNKNELMDYINSEDFIDTSAPEGIQKKDNQKINDLTQKFSINQITNIEYAQELLKILRNNEGEIEEMYIEDFESLCTGVSEFSKRCIDIFYSQKEVGNLDKVADSDKMDYKEFFDNAEDSWIG